MKGGTSVQKNTQVHNFVFFVQKQNDHPKNELLLA